MRWHEYHGEFAPLLDEVAGSPLELAAQPVRFVEGLQRSVSFSSGMVGIDYGGLRMQERE